MMFLKRLVVDAATYAKTATSQKGTLPSARQQLTIRVYSYWLGFCQNERLSNDKLLGLHALTACASDRIYVSTN